MPKGRQRASGRARAVPGAQQGQAERGGQDRAVAAPSGGGTGAGAIWKSLGEGLGDDHRRVGGAGVRGQLQPSLLACAAPLQGHTSQNTGVAQTSP